MAPILTHRSKLGARTKGFANVVFDQKNESSLQHPSVFYLI